MKARVGNFEIWHTGKNAYEIRNRLTNQVVATREQLGLAASLARQLHAAETIAEEVYLDTI